MEPRAINFQKPKETVDRTGLFISVIIVLISSILISYALNGVDLRKILNLTGENITSWTIGFGVITLVAYLVFRFIQMTMRQLGQFRKSKEQEIESLEISKTEYIEQLEQLVEKHSRTIQRQKEQLGMALREVHTVNDTNRLNERMTGLKNLIAGLSHQLNNPVNVIGGVVNPIQQNIRELSRHITDEEGQQLLMEIELLLKDLSRGAKRVSTIVRNFSTVMPTNVLRDADFFKPALSFSEFLENFQKKNPSVRFMFKIPQHLELHANEDEIRKVLSSLLSNAVDAVVNEEEPIVLVRMTQNTKNTSLEVCDNGHGVTTEDSSRLFDPFFTTKQTNNTGGLGLYTAYNIIQNHHGELKMIDREDGLTTFQANIPRYVYKPMSSPGIGSEAISSWSRN